jgi:DNA-binding GntR family transcriptional regulator
MDDERDALRWSGLNWEFHAVLYQPCGMPRLLDQVRTLHTNVQRYLVHYLTNVDYHSQAQEQHRLILELCRAGDAAGASDRLARHLDQAAVKMVASLRNS